MSASRSSVSEVNDYFRRAMLAKSNVPSHYLAGFREIFNTAVAEGLSKPEAGMRSALVAYEALRSIGKTLFVAGLYSEGSMGFFMNLDIMRMKLAELFSKNKEPVVGGVGVTASAIAAVGGIEAGAAAAGGSVGVALIGGFVVVGAGLGTGFGCGINVMLGEPCLGDWNSNAGYERSAIEERLGICEELNSGGMLCGSSDEISVMKAMLQNKAK